MEPYLLPVTLAESVERTVHDRLRTVQLKRSVSGGSSSYHEHTFHTTVTRMPWWAAELKERRMVACDGA